MAQLEDRIKKDLHMSILNRDTAKKDILRVIFSEMNKIGKTVSDEEIIKIIKKQIESAKLCHTEEEIPLLEVYLPTEMTDKDLEDMLIIGFNFMDRSIMSIGEQMKLAKSILGPHFDGKRVSAILKTL